MSILVGKPVTTWTWTQWDTRPCPVVYRYKGEGKADGQMSGCRWDGLSSVSPEDRDTYFSPFLSVAPLIFFTFCIVMYEHHHRNSFNRF